MRLIVYPHQMDVGGSQLNAIELAGAVQRLGHETVVFGVPGPLCQVVEQLGLEFCPSVEPSRRPSPAVMSQLGDLVRERGVDMVHAYEWPPTLEASYGPHLRQGTPVVSTVMSMGVAPFIPRDIALTVGTRAILEDCRRRGRPATHLLEPPVDTDRNAPGSTPAELLRAFDTRWGLDADDFVVVVVSRLATELKRDGLLEAVDVAASLAATTRIRLLVVGDGPVRPELESRARSANGMAGREVVTLTGELMDPRPAYDRAVVVLGMGSSALRGMAFAKPLVVQGERGFWSLLTPDSLPVFLEQGWYGVGDGRGGVERLSGLLARLAAEPQARTEAGRFSREVVTASFSLDAAARRLVDVYASLVSGGSAVPGRLASTARSSAGLASYKVQRRYQRIRGTAPVEDFNAARAQPRGVVRAGGPR